jgi:hypothetical protein
MAMAVMKVCSAQGFLGAQGIEWRGVSDPKNGRFTQKWPFLGKTVQS